MVWEYVQSFLLVRFIVLVWFGIHFEWLGMVRVASARAWRLVAPAPGAWRPVARRPTPNACRLPLGASARRRRDPKIYQTLFIDGP